MSADIPKVFLPTVYTRGGPNKLGRDTEFRELNTATRTEIG
jgi:hypothetical protein